MNLVTKNCFLGEYANGDNTFIYPEYSETLLSYHSYPAVEQIHLITGIKHGFSCINIRKVPWEVLKTEAGGRGFQHLTRDLANDNALEKPCWIAIIA